MIHGPTHGECVICGAEAVGCYHYTEYHSNTPHRRPFCEEHRRAVTTRRERVQCVRCGRELIGPAVVGHARLGAGAWACGFCATDAEVKAHLAQKLEASDA